MIKIKRLTEDAILPKYHREGDAAIDLHSTEELVLLPNKKAIVGTGLAMAIPLGHVGLIWDRSSIAVKFGTKSLGGVIDSNYRGEIKVILHNLSQEPFEIKKGMRIAQMIFQKFEQKEIIEVEELDETERGEGRFGSSGFT